MTFDLHDFLWKQSSVDFKTHGKCGLQRIINSPVWNTLLPTQPPNLFPNISDPWATPRRALCRSQWGTRSSLGSHTHSSACLSHCQDSGTLALGVMMSHASFNSSSQHFWGHHNRFKAAWWKWPMDRMFSHPNPPQKPIQIRRGTLVVEVTEISRESLETAREGIESTLVLLAAIQPPKRNSRGFNGKCCSLELLHPWKKCCFCSAPTGD